MHISYAQHLHHGVAQTKADGNAEGDKAKVQR